MRAWLSEPRNNSRVGACAEAPSYCVEKSPQYGITICARLDSIITVSNIGEVAELSDSDTFLFQCPLDGVLEDTAPEYGGMLLNIISRACGFNRPQ